MKILGMGTPELLIILVVVLLIFGPKNLPKLGSAIGKSVKGLREGLGSSKKDAEAEESEEGVDAVKETAELEESEESEQEAPEKPVKKRVVKKATA